MADEAITCRYVFSSKEFSRAMRCYWRHTSLKWWLLLIAAFIIGSQIYSEATSQGSDGLPAHPITVFSVFLDLFPMILFIVILVFLLLFLGGFAFRKTSHFNQEMIYTLRDAGLNFKSSLAESEIKWGVYVQATENRNGFALFHKGKRVFNWLPKSGFENPESIALARELFRRQIKDTKRLLPA